MNPSIQNDLHEISTAVKMAQKYNLVLEVLLSSMKYLQEHPHASIKDATDYGINEWLK